MPVVVVVVVGRFSKALSPLSSRLPIIMMMIITTIIMLLLLLWLLLLLLLDVWLPFVVRHGRQGDGNGDGLGRRGGGGGGCWGGGGELVVGFLCPVKHTG